MFPEMDEAPNVWGTAIGNLQMIIPIFEEFSTSPRNSAGTSPAARPAWFLPPPGVRCGPGRFGDG